MNHFQKKLRVDLVDASKDTSEVFDIDTSGQVAMELAADWNVDTAEPRFEDASSLFCLSGNSKIWKK